MAERAPTIGVSSGFTDYGDHLGVALSRRAGRPSLRGGGGGWSTWDQVCAATLGVQWEL
jgi:hypothetical protein